MRKITMLAAVGLAALVAAAAAVAATTVKVHPFNMDSWAIVTDGGGSVTFVNGPATPPLGTGSAQFSVGPNGDDDAQLRNSAYAGTKLSSLTALKYSSYVQQYIDGQDVYVILNVDYTGDGSTDDLLFFEPVYQDATYCPSNPQSSVALHTWQSWDALHGCWWSVNGTAGANPGTDVKPLSAIIAAEPNATIVNSSSGGGVRLVTGFGAGSWDNFVGNADAFTINGTTYDFNPDVPGPTSKDQCKNGGWKNFDSPAFKNQGDCIQYVNTGK